MNELARMEKKIKKQLHTTEGFTLAETLLAVLILLMVSTIVATGIPVAKNAYEKVVMASNAEVLLSTTISTLRNELGTAQDVTVTDAAANNEGKTITYYSATRGSSSKLYVDSTASGGVQEIMFQRYYSADDLIQASAPEPLVSSKTSTGDLYITYASVKYKNGIVTFSGLSVNRRSGSEGLAARDYLSIRVISYQGD